MGSIPALPRDANRVSVSARFAAIALALARIDGPVDHRMMSNCSGSSKLRRGRRHLRPVDSHHAVGAIHESPVESGKTTKHVMASRSEESLFSDSSSQAPQNDMPEALILFRSDHYEFDRSQRLQTKSKPPGRRRTACSVIRGSICIEGCAKRTRRAAPSGSFHPGPPAGLPRKPPADGRPEAADHPPRGSPKRRPLRECNAA